MDNMQDNEPEQSQYYQVSPLKFSLMMTCTLGLYGIYWSYKNWRYIKERDNSNIYPVWRGIFTPFWYYSLLTDIADHGEYKYLANKYIRGLLAAAYLLLSSVGNLPDPYWIMTLLAFLPFIPAVQAIIKINASALVQQQGVPHNAWNFAAYLLVGPFLIFMILTAINYIPSTTVTDGARLWKNDLEYLTEQGLLANDENIRYFYSSGLLSIEDDGQFITNGYVVSYWRDPDDGELYGGNVAYEDIADISVVWSGSQLEDTVVTITDTDDYEFEMWLSSEARGDRKFVDELMSRWNKVKDKDIPHDKQLVEPGQITV